jgi:hypothetical protein
LRRSIEAAAPTKDIQTERWQKFSKEKRAQNRTGKMKDMTCVKIDGALFEESRSQGGSIMEEEI